jgi:hypothetical protein
MCHHYWKDLMYQRQAALWILVASAAVLLASTASAVVLEPPIQHRIPHCRYIEAGPPGPRGNVLRVDRSVYVRLRREGPVIQVIADHLEEQVQERVATCEGRTATIHSIDRIVYAPPEGSHELTVDESRGRFGPGASKEPGGDEIEISVKLPFAKKGRPSRVEIVGGNGPDRIRVGALSGGRTGFNLDADRDGAEMDADVVVSSVSRMHIQIHGGNGGDRLSAAGAGREFLGPLPPPRGLDLRGEGGSNLLVGSPRNDHLGNDSQSGDGGADLVYGRGGEDTIVGSGSDREFGGPGDDMFLIRPGESEGTLGMYSGGPGRDGFDARDEARDRILCGPGIDNALVEPIDIWSRPECEHVHGFGVSG